MKKLLIFIMVIVFIVAISIMGCATKNGPTQLQQTYEGRVIAVSPRAMGSFTNTYIGAAVIYFEDGTILPVYSDLVLILGGYYIITTFPPINKHWEYLEIESIAYKP